MFHKKKHNIMSTDNHKKDSFRNDDAPILIPKISFVEGYIKSHKAIRIECNFNGTIFTNNRVIIDGSSKITGDIICSELLLEGTIEGNVFCVGRVSMNNGARVIGKIYTAAFTNEHNTHLECVIQIPNPEIITKAKDILEVLDMDNGLSVDPILTDIRDLFYDNVYARTTNPDKAIINNFTQQAEVVKKSKTSGAAKDIVDTTATESTASK